MFSKNQKRQRLIAFIFVNMIEYPRTLKSYIYYSNKRRPPPSFHPDTSPVIGHTVVHSVDKTHVLAVTMELIWLLFLNILSFNFALTPRKSLMFTRLRRSCVSCPVIVLTSHCSKWLRMLLCSCLFPMIVHLRF